MPAHESMEQQVRDICVNAKTSYPGGAVCNAVEKILFHKDVAASSAPEGLRRPGGQGRGNSRRSKPRDTCIRRPSPPTEADWPLEYLALIVAVKVVDSLDEAVDHINEYGSRHTDAILTPSLDQRREFTQRVDSASVMVNASTRFADGGEYGLGAEIGISTDKLHARGPMGAADLTTLQSGS